MINERVITEYFLFVEAGQTIVWTILILLIIYVAIKEKISKNQ